MSTEQTIVDAKRVDAFLADPAVIEAFARLRQRYFEQFVGEKDRVVREALWAKTSALADLQVELKAVIDAGTMEEALAKRRAPSPRR